MNLNEASRIIEVIDSRITKRTASGARVETTWGEVVGLDANRKTVSAYLFGETDSAYASPDFRVTGGLLPNVGDSIKVAIDRERGDRWVEEVYDPNTYPKVEFDIVNGQVRFGGGAAAADTRLYRSTTKTLRLDDGAGGDATLDILGSIAIGGDTNLYRSAANVLKTDDVLHAVAGLRVSSPGSQDSQGFAAIRYDLPNNGYTGLLHYISGEANPMFKITGGGVLEWGPGGASALDTNLYRSGASVLKTDDSLVVGGTLYVGSGTGAGQSADGVNISGGSIEMRNANPFIDFKTTDEDYGARIIYDFNLVDGMEFAGASRYKFDNTVQLDTGDLYSDSTFDFFTLASAAQQLKAKSILLSTSFADPTPNAAGIQFGADTNLYRSAADLLKTDDTFEAPAINMTGVTTNTTFSINNGGTATFSSKSLTWARIGPWVFMRLSFSVTANGSGTSTVTITGTGLPQSSGTPILWGDRGGTGVMGLEYRGTNAGGEMTLSRIRELNSGSTGAATVTGADLANGASYTCVGVYYTADAF